MEAEQSSSSTLTSYQYPLLILVSVRNLDNASVTAAVGIARENNGSHDHGPTKAILKVVVRTSSMHSNHRHAPSNHRSCILTTCQRFRRIFRKSTRTQTRLNKDETQKTDSGLSNYCLLTRNLKPPRNGLFNLQCQFVLKTGLKTVGLLPTRGAVGLGA